MKQAVLEPVRSSAPDTRQVRRAAFCRVVGAAFLLALASACQQDGSPTQNRLTGSLAISVNGLPSDGVASITVTGTGGFSRVVTKSETLTDLPIGNYGIAASEVNVSGDQYAPVTASQSITLTANIVMGAAVDYAAATGRIQLNISGIPSGTSAAVQVTGPRGYSHVATGSELITGLAPGEYTLSTGDVNAGGTNYLAAPGNQPVTVTAGTTTTAGITYIASSGSLALAISGLPSGVPAAVRVSGPDGYNQTVIASQTLSGLGAGNYQITAAPVDVGGTPYTPTFATQSVAVVLAGVASAQVTYVAGAGSSLDLRVDAVYLTQATQRYDGSVPLVAGRDAYLRAFVVSNQSNTLQPTVRVRLYNGTSLAQTYMIPAPSAGVPTSPSEGVLGSSWNVLVPGTLIQPGLRVIADVDPSNSIAEFDKANNQFPTSGVTGPVDVRALPPFSVRLVPVLQQSNSLAGNVTSGNLQSFLTDLKQVLPIGAYDADIHAVYTTTAPTLQSSNGNNGWNIILSELLALRTADASTRYYYGVVKTSYNSGVAGMGFVGGTARTALGWDFLPSASDVMAHELGHTMGRQHAPCGGVAGPDPDFPYAGGSIGVWGLQLNGLVTKSPSTPDLMSYCEPSWISDYNWTAMIQYRQSGFENSTAGMSGDGLLVWGRITPQGIVLEPAFRVPATAGNRPTPGTNQLDLLDGNGGVLRTIRFGAPEVGDLPGGPERQFAFVVPGGTDLDGVAGFRVRADGQSLTRMSQTGGDPDVAITRADQDRLSVRWNASRYPMVLVRDAVSGRVLSFARGGEAMLWSDAQNVDLQFSSGSRVINRRERVLK